ncbi:MAG: glycosyltransferase family 9 protein [Mucilaginibacter sp.]
MNTNNPHILISRTDAIGDVVLTLPMCGYFKSFFPGATISFLGRTYTAPVINACAAVDHFINFDELQKLPEQQQAETLRAKNIDTIVHVFPNKQVAGLAKAAGIKLRIGTTNRLFHWYSCNKLVKLSRKNSDLHEALLNIALLKPFGIPVPLLADVYKYYDLKPPADLAPQFKSKLAADKFNLILHPKSHGSGAEWGLDKFAELIKLLPAEAFNVIITGSPKEQEVLKDWLKQQSTHIVDLTGQMSLTELINFISYADGLLAAGTGPLHIAAATGIYTLGLFPCKRPIHPGRWAPLGAKAEYLESDGDTLHNISPATVAGRINSWKK